MGEINQMGNVRKGKMWGKGWFGFTATNKSANYSHKARMQTEQNKKDYENFKQV